MAEIERLQGMVEEAHGQMRALVEMVRAVGVQVWFDEDGITIINEALESPCSIALGEGYMGLGAAGT